MFSRRTAWNRAPNRYTAALEQHRHSGRELLDLTASNPTTVSLSYREAEILQAWMHPEALTYRPSPKGLESARAAIAGYYAEKGTRFDLDDIVLTTSTSEAYSFVFRLLCNPGDSVLVPVPSYPLFDFLADLSDVTLVPYELVYDHGWQIDFESLRASIRRAQQGGSECRAVLVVHPNNPTGSYAKRQEIVELNQVCATTAMAIISDEVFLDYSLNDEVPLTLSGNADVLTFTLSGLSKISALPQMKVAWVATTGPADNKTEALSRLEVISDTYLSMSAPVQLAVPAMLAERDNVQPQLLQRIHANLTTLDGNLAAQTLCQRLNVEGGWYVILRVPVLGTDEDLSIALLRETGVLLQPGHFYNFPSDGYLIASLITPCDEFKEGIRRVLGHIAER
jgi:alanine-synthesizing transaminase